MTITTRNFFLKRNKTNTQHPMSEEKENEVAEVTKADVERLMEASGASDHEIQVATCRFDHCKTDEDRSALLDTLKSERAKIAEAREKAAAESDAEDDEETDDDEDETKPVNPPVNPPANTPASPAAGQKASGAADNKAAPADDNKAGGNAGKKLASDKPAPGKPADEKKPAAPKAADNKAAEGGDNK